MALFGRIGRLVQGFLSLFISGVESANPEALMEAARQEFRGKMAGYNVALAKMAGVAERLKGQVRLRPRGPGAGAPHPREPPGRQHGARRQPGARAAGAEGGPRQRHARAAETEEAYQVNLRQARLSQQEFEDKVRRLEKQLSQVKIKEAQAEAATALSSVALKVGDLGDTMKTVEEILQKRYEVSAGKARVARDMVDIEQVQERRTSARRSSRRRWPNSSPPRACRRRPSARARRRPGIDPKEG